MKQTLNIIKIGGNVLDNPVDLHAFIQYFAALRGPRILVHGGGKTATTMAHKLGIPQNMVDGRRITDAATLDTAVMVYAGLINKKLVAGLQAADCNAIGLCGADANLIRARKRAPGHVDYGLVGDIERQDIDAEAIGHLLSLGFCPVFSAITHNGSGQLLNTNADTIASVLALAMSEFRPVNLSFCFEAPGVLAGAESLEVLPRLSRTDFERMKQNGTVSGGMIPKLEAAFSAAIADCVNVNITCFSALGTPGHPNSGTLIIP